jgi:hypothetical protein
MNGKGDGPRPMNVKHSMYRNNFDNIFKLKTRTISMLMDSLDDSNTVYDIFKQQGYKVNSYFSKCGGPCEVVLYLKEQ